VDIVLSGQMMEHCEFFWLAFAEMIRVLKPDGILFVIVPSAGPIHRYPVDCYRFYPDALVSLAKYARCHLVESWHDERGPWKDLLGVFAKQSMAKAPRRKPAAPAALGRIKGSAEEEATRGAVPFRETLAHLHQTLQPSLYLEIGVRRGYSLALARGPAVGVEPFPELCVALPPSATVVETTSDDFFEYDAAALLGGEPDLVFIDGLHLCEYALRDFMNVERLAAPHGLIVIDDVFPNHPAQAARKRRTSAWTGDVWKLHAILRTYRRDLFLLPLDTSPTGLLLVAGLDRANRVLWDNYNPILRTYDRVEEPPPGVLARVDAVSPKAPEVATLLESLKQVRAGAMKPRELTRRLQPRGIDSRLTSIDRSAHGAG
jgi:predicted O-methyltransferase YrrM